MDVPSTSSELYELYYTVADKRIWSLLFYNMVDGSFVLIFVSNP